jgi:GNAT superfamily N-acetyltransferase
MALQDQNARYKACRVPRGDWKDFARKSRWADNPSVRNYFKAQVKERGNRCAVLQDTKSSEYVGFLGIYLSETGLREKHVVMVQIGYIYLDESVRGRGLSKLLAEWAERRFARWVAKRRTVWGGLPVKIQSQSECLSPAGTRIVEQLDAALLTRARECGYSFQKFHTHHY